MEYLSLLLVLLALLVLVVVSARIPVPPETRRLPRRVLLVEHPDAVVRCPVCAAPLRPREGGQEASRTDQDSPQEAVCWSCGWPWRAGPVSVP